MTTTLGQTIRWRQLCKQAIFWLFAELALGIVGLDDLIDCIEYLTTRQRQTAIVQPIYLSSSNGSNAHISKEPLDFMT